MSAEDDLRTLAHRIVRATAERVGPFTPARRAHLLLAARQLLEECSPPERAEWSRAFGVRMRRPERCGRAGAVRRRPPLRRRPPVTATFGGGRDRTLRRASALGVR